MSSTYLNQAIQPVSITLASGVATNTAIINAVGSNAFLVWGGFNTNEALTSLYLDEFAYVNLTNSTTVTATRSTSVSGTNVYSCSVIDPSSALVTSVQAGTIVITAGTSNTATITSVNTALSAVFFLGCSTNGTTLPTALCGVTLTNSTTVTAHVNTAATCTVSYVVVTFASAAINNIQQFANTSTVSTTADSVTPTTYTIGNCLLAYGGYTTASTTFPTGAISVSLGSTTIAWVWNTATTSTRTNYATLIQFSAGVLKSNSFNNPMSSSSGSSTFNRTISSIITSNSFIQSLGVNSVNAIGAPNTVFATIAIANATTLTATWSVADPNNGSILEYFLVEFTPRPPSGMFLCL